jgi:hypothetical protein
MKVPNSPMQAIRDSIVRVERQAVVSFNCGGKFWSTRPFLRSVSLKRLKRLERLDSVEPEAHGHAMLQKLGDHIKNCRVRGDDAERRGIELSDLEAKAESERMAKAWRHLARSYEFIESLEHFLLDGRTAKDAVPLAAAEPHCPRCSNDMQLLGIEDDDAGELFTFECDECGHLEAMGIPAE